MTRAIWIRTFKPTRNTPPSECPLWCLKELGSGAKKATMNYVDIAMVREAAKRFPCRRCKSNEVTEVKFSRRAFHSGKAVCGGCGRFRLYLPKPRDASLDPPSAVFERTESLRLPVAPLRGESEEQVARARAIRAKMIRVASRRRDLARAAVLRAIEDAAWYITNEKRRYGTISWPMIDQMAVPETQVDSTTVANAESSDLCDLLLHAKETDETPVETDWFLFLEKLQMEQ